MSDRLAPAPGVRLYYLDDAGVLFCEARQELHLMNTAAALIFSLLEEHGDEAAIVAGLAPILGVDADASRELVRTALVQWREQGFVGASVIAPAPTATPAPAATASATATPTVATDPTPASHAAQLPAAASFATRRYRLLSSRFLLRFSNGAQVRVVEPILDHLQEDDVEATVTSTIDIVDSDGRIGVYHDEKLTATCAALDELAPIVKSTVWQTVLRDEAYFLDIHAGVVSDGERCLLLPAAPGSGKSTLTAALAHAGFEFFSDEVALLEDDTLDVLPVPLALCVKDAGIDALAQHFPRLRALPVHRRGDGKRVVYLPPAREQRPRDERARRVHALVFPQYVPGSETALTPLARPAALQALLSQCLRVAVRLDCARVERIVSWIAKLPCYALRVGTSEAAVAAIETIFPLDRAAKLSSTAQVSSTGKLSSTTDLSSTARQHDCRPP